MTLRAPAPGTLHRSPDLRSARSRSARSGARSVTGHRRAVNEDAFVCGPTWFAVADGMGGHLAGDVASTLTIDVLRRHRGPVTITDVRSLIDEANDVVRARARIDGTPDMGTTLVGAVHVEQDGQPAVAVFHVGDSRCYRFADGTLTLITHDHSHVQELLDAGRLSVADARHHRLRNVITRAVGIEADVRPDVRVVAEPVGRLLMCSDGLTAELSARTIGRVLAAIGDPQAAADRLVELALRGAARDNVTALVVDPEGVVA